MNPYYQDDAVTIFHGDCREILPQLEPVDLVMTDPPYGFATYRTDKTPTPEMWRMIFNKTSGAMIFGYPEKLVELCISQNKVPDDWIVWWPLSNKSRANGFSLPRESEHIAIFGKIDSRYAMRPRKQDTWTIKVSLSRGLDPDWCRDGDVWRDSADGIGNNGAKQHCNEKPLKLIKRLFNIIPSMSVLDPFMGSGTTLRAAKDLGRKAIGIEIEEKYCEIAAKRMAQEVLNLSGTEK